MKVLSNYKWTKVKFRLLGKKKKKHHKSNTVYSSPSYTVVLKADSAQYSHLTLQSAASTSG